MSFLRLSLLATCVAAAACAATAHSEEASSDVTTASAVARPIQMHDVSVLFPLEGKTQAEIDASYLASTTAPPSDPTGALLPQPIWKVVNDATAGIRPPPKYEDLRLVAFRLEPCFAHIGPITDPSSCDNQIRLIFQGVSAFSGAANAADGGFHVLYTISRADFISAVNDMTELRLANDPTPDLGALRVHPIVSKQGMSGPMAKGLEKIVLRYAVPKNIEKITAFHGIFAQGTSWLFSQAKVENGVATLENIPTTSGPVESSRLGTAPEGLLSLSITPSTNANADRTLLNATAGEATDAQRKAAFDAAFRIQNPGFESPNTIDCISCHTAQIATDFIGEKAFNLSSTGNPNVFRGDPSIPEADLAITVPVVAAEGLSLNLHAFSYDGKLPTIMSRVVNETASIVAYVNGNLIAK